MYIILVSSNSGGAGRAYGPFKTRPEAQSMEDKLIEKWAEDSEYDTIQEYNDATACYGPWVDILEVADPELLIKREG